MRKDIITTLIIFTFSLVSRSVGHNQDYDKMIISFLNVGQGDGAVVQYNEANIIVDVGPGREISNYAKNINPLKKCKIDYLFLTHIHDDHVGGLDSLTDHCEIISFMINDVDQLDKYLSKISDKNSINNILSQQKITKININNLEILNINPHEKNSKDENISLITLLNLGNFEAMFLADNPSKIQDVVFEDEILNNIDLPLEVLKISHHGSRYSLNKTLVERLKPVYCVISVGKNMFGHPNEGVLEYLISRGCKVLRTDLSGTILFKYNPSDGNISIEESRKF